MHLIANFKLFSRSTILFNLFPTKSAQTVSCGNIVWNCNRIWVNTNLVLVPQDSTAYLVSQSTEELKPRQESDLKRGNIFLFLGIWKITNIKQIYIYILSAGNKLALCLYKLNGCNLVLYYNIETHRKNKLIPTYGVRCDTLRYNMLQKSFIYIKFSQYPLINFLLFQVSELWSFLWNTR